jgi:hypothetical protein
MPDMVVTTIDSILYDKSVAAFYVVYPDPVNFPDSFIVVDTTLDYNYYNYYSATYVVSPGMRRIEDFPVSSGILGFRQPEDTVIGAGSALHLKRGTDGLLVTTGADGWLNAWECGWSDNAALWPMAGHDLLNKGYVPLSVLGEEIADAEFLPKDKFFNYPNPVTGDMTTIRFYLNQPATVTVSIIDAVGDEIWSTERYVSEGNAVTEVGWELDDVASGVYHCRIEAVASSGGASKVAFKTIAVVK